VVMARREFLLDSSVGYGTLLSVFSRLQAYAAGNDNAGVKFDRLYAKVEYGPIEIEIEIEVGRNVVSIEPGRRTQIIWGSQPPPLNHVGLSIGNLDIKTLKLKLGGAYLLGRLDAPQYFSGSLVTVSRGYLEVAEHFGLHSLR
jgi:hypothetical protein